MNPSNVYRAQGKLDKAIVSYTSAIEIEPYFPNSDINLADLYKSTGKEELALNVLSKDSMLNLHLEYSCTPSDYL
ncbi:tetratricopeptide repeat protein [Vibrio rotiferianus]